VRNTYYSINGGPTQTGTTVFVPEPAGTVTYTLEFWSDDYSGITETPNTATFTIHGGTGTLRLIWGDSDTGGSPCPPGNYQPYAQVTWTIRNGATVGSGPVVATGSGICPGWDGVDDIVVNVSPTPDYNVIIDWWDDYYGYYDQTSFPNIDVPEVKVTTHGDLILLRYP